MNVKQPNRMLVNTLPISDVVSYLTEHGWQRVATPNRNAFVFRKVQDDQPPLVLALPARKSLVDANRRLNDVVRSLAALEASTPEQIVRRILAAGIHRRAIEGKVIRARPAQHNVVLRPRTREKTGTVG